MIADGPIPVVAHEQILRGEDERHHDDQHGAFRTAPEKHPLHACTKSRTSTASRHIDKSINRLVSLCGSRGDVRPEPTTTGLRSDPSARGLKAGGGITATPSRLAPWGRTCNREGRCQANPVFFGSTFPPLPPREGHRGGVRRRHDLRLRQVRATATTASGAQLRSTLIGLAGSEAEKDKRTHQSV